MPNSRAPGRDCRGSKGEDQTPPPNWYAVWRRFGLWLVLAWLVVVQVAFYKNMLGKYGQEAVDRLTEVVSVLRP